MNELLRFGAGFYAEHEIKPASPAAEQSHVPAGRHQDGRKICDPSKHRSGLPTFRHRNKGRIASLPNFAMISRKREAISSSASSQVMRCQACVARALSPRLQRRNSPSLQSFASDTAPGPASNTRSRYFATFRAQEPPSYRMFRIPLNFCCPPILKPWNQERHKHRAIVRTRHGQLSSCS